MAQRTPFWPAAPYPQRPPLFPQALNAYLDELSRGAQPTPSSLDFYVRLPDGGELQRVSTHLPETGSLLPLFFAFGFITAEELRAGEEASRRGGDHTDTNFLAWLCQTVAEAVNTSEQHDALKWAIRKYRTDIEERFGLINVTVRSALPAASLGGMTGN